MRNLILLRGAPGSGKSYWIKENNLESYTLSADTIRLMFQSPVTNPDGTKSISQKNDSDVWKFLFELLERRMGRGELTIIDATHARAGTISQYKDLASKYRYRVYVVQFENDLNKILRQNFCREELKKVPEAGVKSAIAKIETQPAPGFCRVISPDEFLLTFSKEITPLDFNQYERIIIIGDIHGCYNPLEKFFTHNPFDENAFYIFLGDYLDRGIQNKEVFEYLYSLLMSKKNVLFLEGNHEVHLRNYGNGDEIKSKEFVNATQPQLESIDKKYIREFYRRLGQMAYFTFKGRTVFVNHGGCPTLVNTFTPTQELIKGVGNYEDSETIRNIWDKNYGIKSNKVIWQVHGHRNVFNVHTFLEDSVVINLCDDVEWGGELRSVELTEAGFRAIHYKNDVFSQRPKRDKPLVEIKPENILSVLRNSKWIRETKLPGGISSFNFTRDAFYKKAWNDATIKARGLFLDSNTGKVIARSYNKFFNFEERTETELPELYKTLKFPVDMYIKENGFLGILSYDHNENILLFCTKSTTRGEYVTMFRDIFINSVSVPNRKKILDYLKENNVSMIFEVIHPNDPHIMDNPTEEIVLLDVIYNDLIYRKLPYRDSFGTFGGKSIYDLSQEFRIPCKRNPITFETFQELKDWIEKFNSNYNYEDEVFGIKVEGYVLEDQNGLMVKFKSPYYKFWKFFRSIKEKLYRGTQVDMKMICDFMQVDVYNKMKNLSHEDLAKSIPEIRKMIGY